MSLVHWILGFVFISAMAVGIMATATYTTSYDMPNRTDTFGQSPQPINNATSDMLKTGSSGAAGISSGMAVFAGGIVAIVMVIGFVIYGKHGSPFGGRR